MKTKCMSCGGSMKKMAVGGTTTKRIIKKSTGGMYGIPQENLGTSGQYGFAKKGGAVKKYQKGGYTVTNADGSPFITPEGYRPPSVPSYPNFKKLKKTDPSNIAFMQLAKNPEEFNPKDVKKYGPKKLSKRMIREMSKESALMQTTPYKKGGATGTHKMPNGKMMLNSKMQNGGTTKADPYGVSLVNKNYKTKGKNKSGGKTEIKPTKIVPKKVDPKAPPKASKTRTIERNGTFEMKKGGATKATKFAALAPPYNKATFADRIAGAKKKK